MQNEYRPNSTSVEKTGAPTIIGHFLGGLFLGGPLPYILCHLLGVIHAIFNAINLSGLGDIVVGLGEKLGGPLLGMGIAALASALRSWPLFVGALIATPFYYWWFFNQI